MGHAPVARAAYYGEVLCIASNALIVPSGLASFLIARTVWVWSGNADVALLAARFGRQSTTAKEWHVLYMCVSFGRPWCCFLQVFGCMYYRLLL
jgi:hypothetical protein